MHMEVLVLIGLTGGIGTGKSSALKCFDNLGWKTLDADLICHNLYSNIDCEAYKLMLAHWGNEILKKDGSINKAIVGDIVFKNIIERKWLNNMLHPMVLDHAIEEYSKCDTTIPMIFDVPLLFEVSWEKYFTKIISTFTAEKIQIIRLQNRGMNINDIKRRIHSQISISEKVEKSDFSLINNGTIELLKLQCKVLHTTIYGSSEPVKTKETL